MFGMGEVVVWLEGVFLSSKFNPKEKIFSVPAIS